MKKTLYQIGMLAAAALAFAACTKEAEINDPKEEVTHVATISLGKADVSTKTEVVEGETSASYKWLDNDAQYLHVYENGTEGTITNFSLNADKTIATLTVSFTGTPEAPYSYTAKYANNLSSSKNPLIPAEQSPKANNFDPAADVLVSKETSDVTNLSDRATEFTFTMGRVVTVNKMTLTGLEAGEVISSVEFTLDKHMAGYVSYSAENNSYSYSNGGTKLTLKYTATNGVVPANGQFPVYFVSAPVDAAGIVNVVVTTDKNVYTKSTSLNPNPFDGKTITFAIGTMKRFNMAMGGYGEAISTGTDYTLVEKQSDLYPGATYIIVANSEGSYYALGAQSTNNRSAVSVTEDTGVITIDNTIAAKPVVLESVAGGYLFKDAESNQYLYANSTSSNQMRSTADGTEEKAVWTISISEGIAHIVNVGNTSRGTMRFNPNNGNPLFAAYASTSAVGTGDLALYVDLDTCIPTLATPSVLAEVQNTNEIYVTWGEVANADGYTVTCTGQADQNIATGVGEATFTALADGTYTVTVTAVSNDHSSYLDSQAATVEDLLVGSPKGTDGNPFSVAEVRTSMDGGNTDACYISGIVSSVQYYYDATHATATYFISDDGTTTSAQFEAYSVKFLENKQWAAGNSQIAVGDEVIIYAGGLTIYQETTYETSSNSGSYLYSLNGVTAETVPTITKTDVSGISADGISNSTTSVSFTDADGWNVAVTPDGTIVTAATISGNTITYSVSANDGNARTGSITITLTKNGRTGVSATINVAQDANSSTTPQTYVDVLTQSWTGVTGTSYTAWTNKKGSASTAVYAGKSAGGNSSIQLRTSGSDEGVVTTTSGGKAKKIKVTWNSNTNTARKLQVYGKSTAYESAADLYNTSNQGTLLTTIDYSTSAVEVTLTGDYQFIGFKSSSSALYLTEVDITWEN